MVSAAIFVVSIFQITAASMPSVPIIKRRMTGQIAGQVGAYGSVGAVMFLTVLSFVTPQLFFLIIGGTAIVTVAATLLFLDEPKGQVAEEMPDGTIAMIDVG